MPFMTSGQERERALFLQPQSPHGAGHFGDVPANNLIGTETQSSQQIDWLVPQKNLHVNK